MRRIWKQLAFVGAVASWAAAPVLSAPASAAELIYFYSSACGYCDAWDRDIGEIYAKTDEGKLLTLRAVSVHEDPPADLEFVKGVIYTPTFVAVEDGRELGRIVGYASDIFFWEQMTGLVAAVGNNATLVTACTDTKTGAVDASC